MLDRGYDAIFIGTGAPRGRDLPDLPGRKEGDASIHVGIDWLAAVLYRHVTASANGSSSSAAAIPPWTAAGPPDGSAARMSGWWSAARGPI